MAGILIQQIQIQAGEEMRKGPAISRFHGKNKKTLPLKRREVYDTELNLTWV